jgi:hypothetical protein
LVVCTYIIMKQYFIEKQTSGKLFILWQIQHEICRNGHRMSCKQLGTNVYFFEQTGMRLPVSFIREE